MVRKHFQLSYKKSYVNNYKYNEAQLLSNVGNELKIIINQFKSSTPAIVTSSGILQLNVFAVVENFETGISKNIPQCLLPLTIDSNDDTLTEFIIHESDNEFAATTAYSLAQIDVSQSFVLSLQTTFHQNGPQAVEQSIQNLICPFSFNENQFASAPHYTVLVQSAYESENPLKFTLALAVAFAVIGVARSGTKLSYKTNLSPGIVIYQLTQHDYTIEQVLEPLAPNGALVYLYPSLVSQDTGFCSGLKNFGSKILGGIKKVAGWVASTQHKVMGTLSGSVSMLHPSAGLIMNTVGNIAGGIDMHLIKR
ncbi:MAG: hypothetical protein EZS28_006604 [Streblomastix strix]|uniref:Uncharacterized protein n=1 Tax=Streblomastix strix TaxID=222440 RepID=A0A5J4WSG0_9EUKA|nr:MAG: hypothetical protein EZS28_006604 [Streblomastix strix]